MPRPTNTVETEVFDELIKLNAGLIGKVQMSSSESLLNFNELEHTRLLTTHKRYGKEHIKFINASPKAHSSYN